MTYGYLYIHNPEDHLPIAGEPELLGWHAWYDRHGRQGKYHAYTTNNPDNYMSYKEHGYIKKTKECVIVWALCKIGGGYRLTDEGRKHLEKAPPEERMCKTCAKKLRKLGLL